ncbi:hypothetical protein [Undibacterium macrobrachii]|uniref:Tetratricopeptide repeat protein n=1 Tax=Undibacterium macrobrachii TaxID=1119058 RepID=A0ABQ2XLC3_9BURK|nr:hypothetical protein [Undibacterium macrobrachii]GGX21430.1 hypothetical protein GCM10011282_29480 [Undibacterium macrobrachii]
MTPSDRLTATRNAAFEGRYEEALNEYVWFHDHALEEQPSVYGVRLSFALSYWMELAEKYPRAREVLVEIRDRKAEALRVGKGDRELLHDVISINENLGSTAETHALFVQLEASSPQLAESSAKLALPAIVAAGDFSLASRHMAQPENRIVQLSESLNQDVEDLKSFPEAQRPHIRDAYVHIYASEVQLVASVLRGLGKSQEADSLTALASKLIKSSSIRGAVRRALEPQLGRVGTLYVPTRIA